MPSGKPSRRKFIQLAAATPVVGHLTSRGPSRTESGKPIPANDYIRIATIGMGGRGFNDTRSALLVPGVELVAAADCYDGRLVHAREVFGSEVATTRDYREILDRSDVDAVIVATPDHWHARIATQALRAGKAVYLEKPMVHDLDEGPKLMALEKETGQLMLVGSQRVSSVVYAKARELHKSGAIGKLNMVKANYNRNSAIGAWQYSIPLDASPETLDWNGFLGDAPKRGFDPIRFFRWRNYWDYGTGVAGDLFVHLFSGIHFVLDSLGPSRVMATGGLRHWKDGRDAPDIMMALFDYPESSSHPPFNMSLQVNFADGGGEEQAFRFIGDEGVMTIRGNSVGVSRLAPEREAGYTVRTFAGTQQEAFLKEYRKKYPHPTQTPLDSSSETLYEAPSDYSDQDHHFLNFFAAMREKTKVVEDGTFGYRAAAPALLCNLSYVEERIMHWDSRRMKVRS